MRRNEIDKVGVLVMHGPSETLSSGRSGQQPRDHRRWPNERLRLCLYGLSLALDVAALVVGYALGSSLGGVDWTALPVPVLLIALSLFVMFSIGREAQSIETLSDTQTGIQRAIGALSMALLAEIMLFFLTQVGKDVSRLGFLSFFIAASMFLVASRLFQRVVNRSLLGESATSSVLLLDGRKMTAEPHMTVIDLTARGLWPDLTQPAMISELSNMIVGFDRVVVACTEDHYLPWSVFLQGAGLAGEISVGADRFRGATGLSRCGGEDTLVISRGTLSIANRMKKRGFDLVVGGLMLLALAPLLGIVAVLIRLDSRGPIFFRQQRIGLGNRNFSIFKFRSMQWSQSDAAGHSSAARDDPRVTRVGAFIRRTSIDELPQLLNVMLGDMSLVGPRPHALGSLAGDRLFWEIDSRYWIRHSLRPGITGLAQIRGFRGSTEDTADLENRLRSDLEYLANWSMVLDLQILMATVRVVVHDKAY